MLDTLGGSNENNELATLDSPTRLVTFTSRSAPAPPKSVQVIICVDEPSAYFSTGVMQLCDPMLTAVTSAVDIPNRPVIDISVPYIPGSVGAVCEGTTLLTVGRPNPDTVTLPVPVWFDTITFRELSAAGTSAARILHWINELETQTVELQFEEPTLIDIGNASELEGANPVPLIFAWIIDPDPVNTALGDTSITPGASYGNNTDVSIDAWSPATIWINFDFPAPIGAVHSRIVVDNTDVDWHWVPPMCTRGSFNMPPKLLPVTRTIVPPP